MSLAVALALPTVDMRPGVGGSSTSWEALLYLQPPLGGKPAIWGPLCSCHVTGNSV